MHRTPRSLPLALLTAASTALHAAVPLAPLAGEAVPSIWQGPARGHAASVVDNGAGGRAWVVTWGAGSKPLAEATITDAGKAALGDVKPGDEVEIFVRALPPGGIRALALRIADRDGEIFQFGQRLDPAAQGWQRLSYRLDAGRAESVYGDNRNGALDPPLRLYGFASMAQGQAEEPRHLFLSAVEGGEVAAPSAVPAAQAPATARKPPAEAVPLASPPPANGLLPVVLASPSGGRGAYGIHRSEEHKQSSKAITDATPPVRELTWLEGGRRLLETGVPGRPALHGDPAATEISIPVNTAAFPSLARMAVRIADADGETFQFPVHLRAGHGGWQDARLTLDPAAAESRYGGSEAGRGVLDPPFVLGALVFMAPEGFEGPASVQLGTITRNAFDPASIAAVARLAGVSLALRTAHPVHVVEKGNEEAAVFRASVPEQGLEAAFRLHLTLTDYEGNTHEWTSGPQRLEAGQSVDIPFAAEALRATGWWRVQPVLLAAEGEDRNSRPPLQLAYIDPVGTRTLPPEENFWFALDSRVRSPEMYKLLASIGVDMLRYGTWRGINPGENQWQWTQYEAEVRSIQAAGMQSLFSITFTPDWAAKPEYVARRDAGEKIGDRPIDLSKVAPRSEALAAAVRTMTERNKALGLSIYDLWNEPDLSGFWQGTTEEYLEFIRVCYEAVKSVQPEATMLNGGIATMSGHGGHGLNPDLIERMIVEVQDHYDAISLHQHGHFRNFQQGLDGVLADHRAKLRSPKPLWFTETGFGGDRRKVAQGLVQKHALARARGAEGLVWFAMYPAGRGEGYNMVDASGPHPVLPAYNEMVRLLRGKRFVKEHDAGRGNWLISFADANETLYVAWNEDAPAEGRRELVRAANGTAVRRLNVMGTEQPLEVFEDLVILPLDRELRYLVVAGTAEVVGAPVDVSDRPRGEIGTPVPVVARLFNPLRRSAVFELRWTLPDGNVREERVELEADGRGEATVALTIPAAAAGEAQPRATLDYGIVGTPISGRLTIDIEAVRRIPSKPFEAREPDFVAVDRANIENPNEADPTRAHLAWGGPDDLGVKVWLGLEAGQLVLRAEVTDDRHVQPHSAENSWQADGVQFGLTLPERGGSWEIGLSRADDGTDRVHAWKAPSGLSRDYGATVALRTTPRDGGMRYEARLPLAGLGVDAALLTTRGIGFNLIVNDDDGRGRKGFAFVAPGLGIRADTAVWPKVLFAAP